MEARLFQRNGQEIIILVVYTLVILGMVVVSYLIMSPLITHQISQVHQEPQRTTGGGLKAV